MTGQYRLRHLPTNRTVALVLRAESWWAKGWGVLGRRSLPIGEGLWLPGVASVHTLGVRFPLDLLFLSKSFACMRLESHMPPGQMIVHAREASHTLELGAGTLAASVPSACVGDQWLLERTLSAGS